MSLETGNVYNGTIVAAWLDTDYNETDGLVVCFDVQCEDGAIRAKHKCFGDQLDRTKEVVSSFGVTWPDLETIEEKAKGAPCRVWIGEFGGKQYGRLNVGSGPKDPEAVDAALAKLKGDDNEPLF